MRRWRPSWILWAVVLLATAAVGCREQTTESGPAQSGTPAEQTNQQPPRSDDPSQAAAPTDTPEELPPQTIPEVKLTEALRDTCLVDVGDPMPEAELPDLGGRMQSLSGLFGQTLTVVCFWSRGSSEYSEMRAVDVLEFLSKDVAEPFADHGVRVIGINEGDPAEVVGQIVGRAQAAFPVLLDPQGTLFSQVAKERMPRTYLLDADGKILWFDVEYSVSSRRDLITGIQFVLGETADAEG